jgi:glycosyltransferase involved in cell wall biosynthesis
MPDDVSNFITVSDYSETLLRRCLPRGAKFYRVHNPIDIEKPPPADPANNNVFTFVGRLSPEKGAALFAAAALKAKVKAIFVGSGAEEGRIREINPHAVLLGWQDRAGVIQAIRSSRAVVFPSLWHETQGLVVIEAAALGIPAIVSDACAAKDNIIDGETGVLFHSANVDDLASKLKLLGSDKQLTNDLGNAAYKRYWSAPCTQERHAAELISCYENILASNERVLR